jgi:hypothetical protein
MKRTRMQLIKEGDTLVNSLPITIDINETLAKMFDAVNCYTYAGLDQTANGVRQWANSVLADARANYPELDPIWR